MRVNTGDNHIYATISVLLLAISPVQCNRFRRKTRGEILAELCLEKPNASFCRQNFSQFNEDPPDTSPTKNNLSSKLVVPERQSAFQRITNTTPHPMIDQYCTNYTKHYDYHCQENKDLLRSGSDAMSFCRNYASACDKPMPVDTFKVASYCRRHKRDYDRFCADPLKYGPSAIRFCPNYASTCGGSIGQPLFAFNDAPTPDRDLGLAQRTSLATPSRRDVLLRATTQQLLGIRPQQQQQQQQLQQRASFNSNNNNFSRPRTPQRSSSFQRNSSNFQQSRRPFIANRSSSANPLVTRLCNEKRRLATQYCFGPLSQSVASINQQCNLFKKFCTNSTRRASPFGR